MAGKKKASATKKASTEKVRLEMRFDPDVYESLKRTCNQADISVNQLMNGLARWAATHVVVGEPRFTRQDENDGIPSLIAEPQPGCVFFRRGPDEFQVYGHNVGYDLITYLDFTERRVVRDDVQGGDDLPKTWIDPRTKKSVKKGPMEREGSE